jgi:hypothetical protein
VIVIVMLIAHRGPDPLIARDFLEDKTIWFVNGLFDEEEKDQDHDDRPRPESR